MSDFKVKMQKKRFQLLMELDAPDSAGGSYSNFPHPILNEAYL